MVIDTVVIDRPQAYEPTGVQIEKWFPVVDPGMAPFGSRVLVQMKKVGKVTRGGILLSEDTQDAEQDNTQIALVRAIGPLSYRKRDNLAEWPESMWCKPGSIVRVPRFGQHERFVFPDAEGYPVEFRLYDDFQMLGLITSDPDRFRAYL
tara:strand:- start:30 stop:476 length:447 start_codon:yes stop_codon:yes gene_type:complete